MKPCHGRFTIRILVLITVSVFAATTPACPTWTNSDWGDCGYSAYYETKDTNGVAEIVFSEITAETVGGHRNCGYYPIKRKVDRAEIDGIALPERAEADEFKRNTYFYAVPPGFDPRTTAITIQIGGKSYRSDLASVKQTGTSVYVKLEPVWW